MSRSTSIGDSTELEGGNLTLSDRLKAFKSSSFDPQAYFSSKCQTMNEKEIRNLRANLLDLKKASAEEMRKSVYANYAAFIRTSKEISALEGQLLSMRNLLSTQAALVRGLSERVRMDALLASADDSLEDDLENFDKGKVSDTEEWLIEFLETLEVLLAERKVDEVMAVIEKGEGLVKEANKKKTLSPASIATLESAIREQKHKLADQLADTAKQPSTSGVEIRSAIVSLKKLGDGPRAHTLLLNSHQQKLQGILHSIRSAHRSFGGALSAALSQFTFATIARAVNDSMSIFGEEPAYSSELVTWAVKQIETFAHMLERNVLAVSAASGGLRAAAECTQICLGHCSLLETRGFALSPVLMRLFKSSIEQALSANLKRIVQSSAALAAADDWSLTFPAVGGRPFSSAISVGSAITSQMKLSSSAYRFNSLVQELLEDVSPLESLQLDGAALDGVLHVFNSYVNLLINALPGSVETEENTEGSGSKIVRMAENEVQQIALLANAALLADELLPRAAMKLLPQANRMDEQPRRASDRQSRLPEQREWKKKLQRAVDRLRDSFCRQHALDLIFTEEGDIRLNAQIYTSMDDNPEEPEWFPSPIFRELFLKMTTLACIATETFVGRERFATILLMRLTETVILWLSDDQNFWQDIEEGPKPLGPLGLQQFYLDMEFVLLFASQGRYLSRNLHQVIKNIIGRAIEVVVATGVDPYSVLPEEDWFAEVAQIAIKMLTGKATFEAGEQEAPTSPNAGLSARSVQSSVLSPGSTH